MLEQPLWLSLAPVLAPAPAAAGPASTYAWTANPVQPTYAKYDAPSAPPSPGLGLEKPFPVEVVYENELDGLLEELVWKLQRVFEQRQREGKRVRPYRREDLEDVRELQAQTLPTPYSASFYSLLLSDPSAACLVAYSTVPPFQPPRSASSVASSEDLDAAEEVALGDPLDDSSDDSDAEETRLMGCISGRLLQPLPDTTTPRIYLLSLAISPHARRTGLATQLFYSLLSRLCAPPSRKATTPHPSTTPKFPPPRMTASSLTTITPPPSPPSHLPGKKKRKIWVSLHVEASNHTAREFYGTLGLRENKILRAYYAGARDGVEVEGVVWVW